MVKLNLEWPYDKKTFQREDTIEIGEELAELSMSDFLSVIAKAIEVKELCTYDEYMQEFLRKLKQDMLQASADAKIFDSLRQVREAKEGWQYQQETAKRNVAKYAELEKHYEAKVANIKKETPS